MLHTCTQMPSCYPQTSCHPSLVGLTVVVSVMPASKTQAFDLKMQGGLAGLIMRLRQDGHEELQVHGPIGEPCPKVLPPCGVRHATNRLDHVFKTSQTFESL